MQALARFAVCLGLMAAGLCAAGCNLQGLGGTPRPTSGTAPASKWKPDPSLKVEVLVFTAHWCPVCRDVPPVLEEVRREFPTVQTRELDFDATANQQLAAQYGAERVPYFVIVVEGRVVEKVRGLPTPEGFVSRLRNAMAKASAKPR